MADPIRAYFLDCYFNSQSPDVSHKPHGQAGRTAPPGFKGVQAWRREWRYADRTVNSSNNTASQGSSILRIPDKGTNNLYAPWGNLLTINYWDLHRAPAIGTIISINAFYNDGTENPWAAPLPFSMFGWGDIFDQSLPKGTMSVQLLQTPSAIDVTEEAVVEPDSQQKMNCGHLMTLRFADSYYMPDPLGIKLHIGVYLNFSSGTSAYGDPELDIDTGGTP